MKKKLVKKIVKKPAKKVVKKPAKKVVKKPAKKVVKKTAKKTRKPLKNYKETLELLEKNLIPIDEETNRIDYKKLKETIPVIKIVSLKRKGIGVLGYEDFLELGQHYDVELQNPTIIEGIADDLKDYLLRPNVLTYVNVILKIRIIDERLLVKEDRYTTFKLLVDDSMINSIKVFNEKLNEFIYEIYFEQLHNVIKRFERYVEKEKRVFEGTFTDTDIANLEIGDIVKIELDRVLLNIDDRTELYSILIDDRVVWTYRGGNYYFTIKTNTNFYE